MPRRRHHSPFQLFRLLMSGRNRKWGFWVAVLLVGVWYIQDVQKRDAYVFAGVPRLTSYENPLQWVHVLTNPGFMVGYSELRRNPLWVAYRISPVKKRRRLPRPSGFTADWRTLMHVSHDDYTGSGFDRGHLAPNYAISQLYGRDAQIATFRMSNIVPQKARLNQEFWQRLEEVEIDHFARRFEEIWVLTGPLFDDQQRFLESGVEIPDAFFKIYLDIDSKAQPRALAFIVPQNVRGTAPLHRYVTTVDEVEARSGFDFFSELPDDIENSLEAGAHDAAWRLNDVSRLPPRYRVKR